MDLAAEAETVCAWTDEPPPPGMVMGSNFPARSLEGGPGHAEVGFVGDTAC